MATSLITTTVYTLTPQQTYTISVDPAFHGNESHNGFAMVTYEGQPTHHVHHSRGRKKSRPEGFRIFNLAAFTDDQTIGNTPFVNGTLANILGRSCRPVWMTA
jgi:hypothetical protein